MVLDIFKQSEIGLTLGEVQATDNILVDIASGQYTVGNNPLSRFYYKRWAQVKGRKWHKVLAAAEIDESVTSVDATVKPGYAAKLMLAKSVDAAIENRSTAFSGPAELGEYAAQTEEITVLRGLSAALHSEK